jgi:hypothetical protein
MLCCEFGHDIDLTLKLTISSAHIVIVHGIFNAYFYT